MIKRIVIIAIISQCIMVSLSAQSPHDNLQKYWYYRNRLKNFVKVSSSYYDAYTEAGTSIPASMIDTTLNKIYFDDGNGALNQYISVLATEYRLLKNYGQDYTSTWQELFYALMSLIRLDYTAEYYYRSPNITVDTDNNGFFVRSDVTYAFWSKYSKNGSTPYFKVNTLNGYLDPTHPYANNYEMSEDNVVHYLEALSLVNALVDDEIAPGETSPTSLKDLAKGIASNMVSYMYHPADIFVVHVPVPDNSSPFSIDFSYMWYVMNPITHNFVQQGSGTDGSMLSFSYGFAQAGNRLTTNGNYTGMDNSQTIFQCMLQAPMNNLHLTLNLTTYACIPIPLYTTTLGADLQLDIQGDNYSFCVLDIDYGLYHKSVCKDITAKTLADLCDFSYDDYKIRSLAATGNINADGENNTYKWLSLKQHQNNIKKYEHLPLIWSVLNNDYSNITKTDKDSILLLLNSAPQCGPYYFSSSDNGGDWSSDSRLIWPENNRTGINHGEFNGLDYMLLHNLYWLANPVQIPNSINSLTINSRQPAGSFTAEHSIICPNPITLTGPINLYASDYVELEPGFQLNGSGDFSINISEVTSTAEALYFHKLLLTNYNANSCPDRLK
jgi:hypothetical protein